MDRGSTLLMTLVPSFLHAGADVARSLMVGDHKVNENKSDSLNEVRTIMLIVRSGAGHSVNYH